MLAGLGILAQVPSPESTTGPYVDRASLAGELLNQAQLSGDAARGALVFSSPRYACITCHRIGREGGDVGPELTQLGAIQPPEQIVESLVDPRRQVKEGFAAIAVAMVDGRMHQGYPVAETDDALTLRDPQTGEILQIARADIEETREVGTLMPDGLVDAMTEVERRDLVRFLIGLGKPGSEAVAALVHVVHAPTEFSYERGPLYPEDWPAHDHYVNRERIYDFYTKEAAHFARQIEPSMMLPQFPGIDGGVAGHWGNQNDDVWVDGRWNESDLGTLQSGIFRGAGVIVPKGVCVRLGDQGELSACFNPETLEYEAVWSDGFLRFSAVRHGLMDGILLDGTPKPVPPPGRPPGSFVYHGFYRHGPRVLFSYSVNNIKYLDAPWVENGEFVRVVAPAAEHPLAYLTRGGGDSPRWPQVLTTPIRLGAAHPYAVDTIEPPFQNPWNALLFFGDHDFLADGRAAIATIQGDVWTVDGLDDDEHRQARWRRFATGLHQALGLVVADGTPYVLGRDQITRLHDLDADGEADFYECVNNQYTTSTAGHDFICGLQRDADGNFYTASGKDGILKIAPKGGAVETIATGFRNPNGLGLGTDGTITVPCSEGEWTPASMICEITPGGQYGYPGPRNLDTPPDLPLVYLPRGLDNSSGAQVFVDSDRFGPLSRQWIHLSSGAGTAFLLLRDRVESQAQGAVVPLPWEFRAGAQRARVRPQDGQLYVSGMAGWGTYTPDDGCFHRVRYTGGGDPMPEKFEAYQNGVLVRFSAPLDRRLVQPGERFFAQVWNYRYSSAYGSPEFSPRHPGVPGHDPLVIRSIHLLDDPRSIFFEMPEIQPVNQLHLHMRPVDNGRPIDVFATIHRLRQPFTDFSGYEPSQRTIAAHPILADMAALRSPPLPNPWTTPLPGAREIVIEAGKNLTYSVRSFRVKSGETLRITFVNPDVVPHNWALIRTGRLEQVGDQLNRIIAEPDAALRHYIPRTDDILAYTNIVSPQERASIDFQAPSQAGVYPYVCTFPGHWKVMNGEMIVE